MKLRNDSGYECVAICAGEIKVSCWAPVGSEWRPAWGPRPGELHIHITGAAASPGEQP